MPALRHVFCRAVVVAGLALAFAGATLGWAAGHGPRLGEPGVTVIFGVDRVRLEQVFVALRSRRNPAGLEAAAGKS